MTDADGRPPGRVHYAWFVVASATLVVFGALGLARFGYTMLLPPMQSGLGLDNTAAGGLATANMLGYLFMSVAGGALAARFGSRRVIVTGLAVTTLGMLLTGFARSYTEVAWWRLVTGLGSGASNVPVMALMAAWFVPSRRGMAAGIAVTGSSIALIFLGPTVPRILDAYGSGGWRACWFVFAAVCALITVQALVVLSNRPAKRNLEPLGATAGATGPAPAAPKALWADVYTRGVVWHMGLTYLAFGVSYSIYITFFSKHLMSAGGYSKAQAGQLFMLAGWMSLLCGVLWGWVSDRIGRKDTLVLIYGAHTVAFALFGLTKHPAGFAASAILYGLSAWSIPAIMAAACGDLVGARLAPAGLGFITLFMGIGQAAGPAIGGMLADASGGSLSPAMLLAALLAFSGAVSAMLMKHPHLGRNNRAAG